MTTVAYDGKTLAADSMACLGNYRAPKSYDKIRIDKGIVFAISGTGNWFEAWIAWYHEGHDPKSIPSASGDKSSLNLIVVEDGVCRICSHDMPYFIEVSAPDAWGSGEEYAIGAMRAGASAKRAVEIAIECDPHTGGPVQVIDLQSLKAEAEAA